MPHRILVVDDEEDVRNLVAMMLKAEGYQVVVAGTGKEALDLLEEEPPHLIVLDVMMPSMDGWEVCRQIKSNARTRDIPVVFLTVRQQPLDRIIGTEVLNASGYIHKPFEREELISTIDNCLNAAPQVKS